MRPPPRPTPFQQTPILHPHIRRPPCPIFPSSTVTSTWRKTSRSSATTSLRRPPNGGRGSSTLGTPTVSLPDLVRGGIAIVCATVTPGFLAADVGEAFEPRSALYRTPEEAEANALKQIDLYRDWECRGLVRILASAADMDGHLALWREDRVPGLVLLMEGADPIVRVSHLSEWWKRGLLIVGLTYGDTAYGHGVAGGSATVRRGGLSRGGQRPAGGHGRLGMIWDISHLTETASGRAWTVTHRTSAPRTPMPEPCCPPTGT